MAAADGRTVVLDTGPLIELCDKRRASRALAWLQAMRRLSIAGVVPASVATEFLQGTPDVPRARWWLSHFQGLDVTFALGLAAGMLARSAAEPSAPSAVDAHVVQQALALGADILTGDPTGIQALVGASGHAIAVHSL